MARFARWAFLVLAVTFVTALVEPWIVRGLDAAGWYSDPSQPVGTVVNWIARFIGDAAFPWVAGAVFGLAAGMWVDWALRRMDSARPSKSERLRELSSSLFHAREAIADLISDMHRAIIPGATAANIASIYVSLGKIGIVAPSVSAMESERYIKFNAFYLTEIYPLARDGHYREARSRAAQIVKEVEQLKADGALKPQFRYGQSG